MDLFFKTAVPLRLEDIEIKVNGTGERSYFIKDVLFFGSHEEE